MDISVTAFKQRCLAIIRAVERDGTPVMLTRRGRVVAQVRRPGPAQAAGGPRPWERLRSAGGRLLAAPAESSLREEDLEALR